MARSAPSFSSFTAGEISPRLEGRTDLEKYSQGLSDLTNMIVMPHGGVTRRPGTEYLGEVKSSAVKTRLIPFQFKTSDTYILEFHLVYLVFHYIHDQKHQFALSTLLLEVFE
mgnify:CR=1 FL=1